MAAQLFFLPYRTATVNGIAQPGAQAFFYLTGTTTPTPSYTTSALTTQHAHPVVADGSGRFASVYLSTLVTLRLVIKDRLGTTLADIDPFVPGVAADASELEPYATQAAASAVAAAAYEAGAQAAEIAAETAAGESEASAAESLAYRNEAQLLVDGASVAVAYGEFTVLTSTSLIAGVTGMVDGDVLRVIDPRTAGYWKFHSGDMSAFITANPGDGLWIAPSSATSGASGAWERQIEANTYHAEWWLPAVMPSDGDVYLQRALNQWPGDGKFWFPPRLTTIEAQVLIPRLKPGHYLGYGPNCPIDGQGGNHWVLACAASNTTLEEIYAGNVAGSLQVGEAGGIHFYSGVQAVTGGTADDIIENVKAVRCGGYNAETGIRAGVSLSAATSTIIYNTRDVWIEDFHARDIKRIGIELMASHRAQIINPDIENIVPDVVSGLDRCIRICGARDVVVQGGILRGQTQSVAAIHLSTRNQGDSRNSPEDVVVEGVNAEDVAEFCRVDGVDGLTVSNCFQSGRDDAHTYFMRCAATGSFGAPSLAKIRAIRVKCVNNQAENVAEFFNNSGSLLFCDIARNKWIANANTTARFALINGTAGEVVLELNINDNFGIGNEIASGGTIRAVGTQSGDTINTARNRMTPDSGGTSALTISGDCTFRQPHPKSNKLLPAGLWATYRPALDEEEYL